MANNANPARAAIPFLEFEAAVTGITYGDWALAFTCWADSNKEEGLRLIDIVNGRLPRVPEPAPLVEGASEEARAIYNAAYTAFDAWRSANSKVRGTILQSVARDLAAEFRTQPDAAQVWRHLKDKFEDNSPNAKARLLLSFGQKKLSDYSSLSLFIADIRETAKRLSENGINLHDEALCGLVLNGLNESYSTIVQIIWTDRSPTFNFERICSLLQAHNTMSKPLPSAYSATTAPPLVTPPTAAAATTRGGRGGRSGNTGGPGGGNSAGGTKGQRDSFPPCTYVIQYGPRKGQQCGQKNHAGPSTCFKRLDDAFWRTNGEGKTPPRWNLTDVAVKAHYQDVANSMTTDSPGACANLVMPYENEFADFFAYPGVAPTAQQQPAPLLTPSANLFQTSQIHPSINLAGATPITALTNPSPPRTELTLDSGANRPVFKHTDLFRPFPTPLLLQGADNSFDVPVQGVSTLPLPFAPSGSITGLCLPSSRHNLVALWELQHSGLGFDFPPFKNFARVYNPAGETVAKFTLNDNKLYNYIVEPTTPFPPIACVCTAADVTCPCRSLSSPSVLTHHRLGHMGYRNLHHLATHNLLNGLPSSITAPSTAGGPSCTVCAQSKLQASPHPPCPDSSGQPLDRVHLDLCFPSKTQDRNHNTCFLTIVDHASRYGSTVLLKKKSDAAPAFITWAKQQQQRFGRQIGHVHSDGGNTDGRGGGEFLNSTLKTFYSQEGISSSFTLPDSPEQNGIAEARNKLISTVARTLMVHSCAPQHLWGLAIRHASILHNLFPHPHRRHTTPATEWFGHKPDISKLRIWGCTAHVLLSKENRLSKVSPVTIRCAYMGPNDGSAGYLFYNPVTRTLLRSQDVVFDELQTPFSPAEPSPPPLFTWVDFPFEPTTTPSPPQVPPSAASPQNEPSSPSDVTSHASPSASSPPEPTTSTPSTAPDCTPPLSPPPRTPPGFPSRAAAAFRQLPLPSSPQPFSLFPRLPPRHLPPRMSLRIRGLPPSASLIQQDLTGGGATSQLLQNSPDGGASDLLSLVEDRQEEFLDASTIRPTPAVRPSINLTCLQAIRTPQSYEEAINGPQKEGWKKAIEEECEGFIETETFKTVPRPPGENVVKGKWVLRVKQLTKVPPKLKARYVAKGFLQRKGRDYFETFSPTAKHPTLRVLLDVAARRDMEIHSMDVTQAFLQGHLHETVYLEPPPGYPHPLPPDSVWQLQRPVYGLKQAPREWNIKLVSVLKLLGFSPTAPDPSLFTRPSDGSYVLAYVDDLILTTNTPTIMTALKKQLQEHFKMKDLGELTHYLGMEIRRDRAARTIHLSQGSYIEDVIERFDMEESSPCDTPLAEKHTLSAPLIPGAEPIPEEDRYRELVGCLMYAMVCTRPDLAYPVSLLSRAVGPGRATPEHWSAGKRVLRYLKGTLHTGLTLGGSSPPELTGYSDASWADDQTDRRSTQGYGFTLGGGLISWRSTRSSSTALSSCEAELYAGTMAAQEARWLTYLLACFDIPPKECLLHIDNKSTIQLAKDPVFHSRSKHIELRYYFLRDMVLQGHIRLRHVPTEQNLADIFTKSLGRQAHEKLSFLLGLSPTTEDLKT